MNLSDLDQFRRIVTQHFALYPSAAMNEATVSSWWDDFQPLPLATLPTAFRQAREASPQFPPTAAQIKAIAEVEAVKLAKRLAAQRQSKYLPPPEDAPKPSVLEAFYSACDREKRAAHSDAVRDDDEPAISGLVVHMLRCFGVRDTGAMTRFGGWLHGDCKQRKLALGMVIAGLRKAPDMFAVPPTLGMLTALMRGEDLTGWPRLRGQAPPPIPEESRWAKLASYWEQENGHWEKHPEARREDATEERFRQFWRMWGQGEPTSERSASPRRSPISTPNSGAASLGGDEVTA